MAQLQPQSVRYVTLDVFTAERFKGNPLAIVKLPSDVTLGQDVKQRIAREFNLSETVFLHPPSSETPSRTCDIFTPSEELPFAGHPTIGTLVYLATTDGLATEVVQSLTLQTKAGLIKASFDEETGVAEASIPHNVRIHQKPVPWRSIVDAHPSLKGLEAGSTTSCPLVSIVQGMTFIIINLPRLEDLASLTLGGSAIDPRVLQWEEGWESFTAPYFYVVVSEDEDGRKMHVRSRMLEPSIGEDPATGSAASALAAYLALQRGTASATYSFNIEQGVEMGRKSEIGVKVRLDESGKAVKEVILSGSAVPVSQGTMVV
ncbi:MAG: hypothetical protein Q9212_000079 [Teloschistes hypoglaucus]